MHIVSKTFNPNKGFPCVFRQHTASSHCSLLHGYDLIFKLILSCNEGCLTEQGWVYDFGSFGWLKDELARNFDHTVAVALDDPELDEITSLEQIGIAKVVTFEEGVGCEAFAKWFYHAALHHLAHDESKPLERGVKVLRTEVSEHGGNSASYFATGGAAHG